MTTGRTKGFAGLRYAISDCGRWAIVRFADGKGYSKRFYTLPQGWVLVGPAFDMPPEIERSLCRRLGLACKLDPEPLADAPYITGDMP